jgi:hypothetical protein
MLARRRAFEEGGCWTRQAVRSSLRSVALKIGRRVYIAERSGKFDERRGGSIVSGIIASRTVSFYEKANVFG